jgi:SOS-response transcriptional repressor LexA
MQNNIFMMQPVPLLWGGGRFLRQETIGAQTVNVRSLLLRELGEGMTEKELASAIDVPLRTVTSILANEFPKDSASWKKFARYFRMDVDVLRTGGSTHSITVLNLSDRTLRSSDGLIREIPLLDWHQMGQMVTSKNPSDIIHAEETLDTTDIPGIRTIALKVKDDSMGTMFSKGEIIFVDPDSKWKPGDYVIVHRPSGHPETTLFRQIEYIESHYILHPLNQMYENLPLTEQDKVWGKVVRLTKTL